MSEIDRELVSRYLTGEVSPEESERVEAWLAEDPDRWALLTEVRDAKGNAELSDSAIERAREEVWTRLEGELGHTGRLSGKMRGRPNISVPEFALSSQRSWRTGGLLVAALVCAAVAGTSLTVYLLRSHSPARPEAIRIATTAPGQRAKFRLPDGTQVMLGVASELRYPAALASGSREMSLKGEAYFAVIHDERRPFIVHAGGLVAKDLGTEFTVRAYPEDVSARVVVREGRVAIRGASQTVPGRVVAPGQLGRVGVGHEVTIEPADTAEYFAWTEGRLILDRVPLREALPQLGRWFDLDFRLADSTLGEVPLSAMLKTQPTTDVLNNLAASLGLRQRQVGRIVTLYSPEQRH